MTTNDRKLLALKIMCNHFDNKIVKEHKQMIAAKEKLDSENRKFDKILGFIEGELFEICWRERTTREDRENPKFLEYKEKYPELIKDITDVEDEHYAFNIGMFLGIFGGLRAIGEISSYFDIHTLPENYEEDKKFMKKQMAELGFDSDKDEDEKPMIKIFYEEYCGEVFGDDTDIDTERCWPAEEFDAWMEKSIKEGKLDSFEQYRTKMVQNEIDKIFKLDLFLDT